MSNAVGDLIWAINSPSLLANALNASPIDPRQIDSHDLAQNLSDFDSHRVGYYFERLVLYWLSQICNFTEVRHSIQIRDETRTIGEIDFLFDDNEGHCVHLETAVKFYLHYPQDNHTDSRFIGPNAADTFEKKTGRLFDHQLPLSQQHIPRVSERQAFVKGMIFYHPSGKMPVELPEYLATDHLQGAWIRASEIDWLKQECAAEYQVMHKPFWLSAQESHDTHSKRNADEQIAALEAHFRKSDSPILLHQSLPEGTNRVFVVSNGWPNELK